MAKSPSRRVIPIKLEPPSSLSSAERIAVQRACAQWAGKPGNLIPILHAVQDALGFVPEDSIPLIAGELNLSRAEVHGVVTFYHYFRTQRGGRHVVHVCRAEACQALGAVALEGHVKRSLGVDFHGTTADGAVTLEPVYCLGNCALGPSIMIDTDLKGRVSPQRFDDLMAPLRAEAG
jgi:formate dehydrogenase subunit gamma